MRAIISTDGSYNPATRYGAYAYLVERNAATAHDFRRYGVAIGKLLRYTGSGIEADSTSQRMELMAVIEGLRSLPYPADVLVLTDNQNIYNAMAGKSQSKSDADLWRCFDEYQYLHKSITARMVAGHSGNMGNELAHDMAKALAKSAPNDPPCLWCNTATSTPGVPCEACQRQGRGLADRLAGRVYRWRGGEHGRWTSHKGKRA